MALSDFFKTRQVRIDLPAASARAGGAVRESRELHRILRLPRRDVLARAEELIDLLTEHLRTPNGKMRLFAHQAIALAELHDYRGLFAPLAVGSGKTLLSFLAPVVLEAKRPLLLTRAGLIAKTQVEFAELRRHWKAHPAYSIVSYEALGRETGQDLLNRIDPDVVVCDEVHRLKNRKAACTRRVARALDAAEGKIVFAGMSGTVAQKSLHDFAHLMRWALGNELNPLPNDFPQLREWAEALDEQRPGQDLYLLHPGALRLFMTPEEQARCDGSHALEARDVARIAVRKRITETPGVVATTEQSLGASLTIVRWREDIPEISRAVDLIDERWVTPRGIELTDPLEVDRHKREAALGFVYEWETPGPPEWMQARKTWGRAVRQIHDLNRTGLDSEKVIRSAIERGEFNKSTVPDDLGRAVSVHEALNVWLSLKPSFEPVTIARWFSETMLDKIIARAKKGEPALVWVEHVAVGLALEAKGLPYFGAGGLDRRGANVESARSAGGPVALSIEANKEGRNLQHEWSRSIIVSPPKLGGKWEQIIGRTHRIGQKADEVSVEVLISHPCHTDAIATARAKANFIEKQTGQLQKVNFADWIED